MTTKTAQAPTADNQTVSEVVSIPAPANLELEQDDFVPSIDTEKLMAMLLTELEEAMKAPSPSAKGVALRIALEVERICRKSDRIQTSGEIESWHLTLARHRVQKCLQFYQLGSKRGRVELHSHLAAMVYRHIATLEANLAFQARYNLIEDFMQAFYIESMRAFRREHGVGPEYTPRTQIELAEYMAFTEQYAKRQIGLPGRFRQRLIVLRAQSFAKGQPPEMAIDIEMAVESARTEEAEAYSRSHTMQQVREQMIAETTDPSDSVLRDRVLAELIQYLEDQEQTECVKYLNLKLQDMQASEIDKILGLTARQRDYLQQRFKYHVEKFARSSNNWKIVHQWLGADLDQKLGLTTEQWEKFQAKLSPEQLQLLEMKRQNQTDDAIAMTLKIKSKQIQKRWSEVLNIAYLCRNING